MTNYFSNNKNTWLVALLVLLNVGTLASVWVSKSGRGHRSSHEKHHVERFFSDKLNLSEAQTAQFKTLWEKHKEEVKVARQQIKVLRKERMEVLIQPNPDVSILKEKASQIGQAQIELEDLMSQHYFKLKAVCNEKQQAELGDVFHEIIKRMSPGKRKGRGR